MREEKFILAPSETTVDHAARAQENRRRRLERAQEMATELAGFYLEGGAIDDAERKRLIQSWAEKSDIYLDQRFPIDGGKLQLSSEGPMLDYASLYERHRDLYDLLSRFTGRLRHFSNKDHDDSALIPEAYFQQMNQMYLGLAKKVVLHAARLEQGQVDEEFNQSIQHEIEVALSAFHAVADSFPVAEELLIVRHADIYPQILRDFLVALEPGWSERGASTQSKKFLAALFPQDYGQILQQVLDSRQTQLSPEEIRSVTAVSRSIFTEYKKKRYG